MLPFAYDIGDLYAIMNTAGFSEKEAEKLMVDTFTKQDKDAAKLLIKNFTIDLNYRIFENQQFRNFILAFKH